MRSALLIFLFCFLFSIADAQRRQQQFVSLAVNTNQTALPFGKFAGLFVGPIHPGVEVAYGFNWSSKRKHDVFQRFALGYLYHRFAQHGLPLYAQAGYRYKFNTHFESETAIGGGYFHAIPTSPQLILSDNGTYESKKSIGRPQAMLQLDFRVNYVVNPNAARPVKTFITYKQRLQTPFVKSYVPLLPYNIFEVGVSRLLWPNVSNPIQPIN